MYIRFSDLLSSNRSLKFIKSRVQEISVLQDKLCKRLESPLNQHVIVANFDTNTLIIHTDNPVWATKLRSKVPHILDIVKNDCKIPTISTIRIKVFIPKSAQTRSKRGISHLSTENSNYLQAFAETTDDHALADVLSRLAKHKEN